MNIEILVREIRYKIDKKKRDKKESRAYKNSPKKKQLTVSGFACLL